MFKKANFVFTDPICLCLEQKTAWSITQGQEGPVLSIFCKECAVRVVIPTKQFLASVVFETPYPGVPKKKPVIEVQVPKAGDVIDLTEVLRRRKEGLPS